MFLSGVLELQAGEWFNTNRRYRIEPCFFCGFGFDDIDLGETIDGDTVTLSAGGGYGFGASIGYGINRDFDFDFTVGWQQSSLSPDVNNAEGIFERNIFLATLKYKVPMSNRKQQFKFGIGLGLYHSGEFDVNTTQAAGEHTIINYDDAIGFHITAEYEMFFDRDWSWLVGVKYYDVDYDAGAVKVDGISYAPGLLIDEMQTIDGGGVNFNIGIAKYF
ncbi:MAG: hypothetical protein DRP78_04470 [Candidatus Omnitrophota bacterium]|nr:MAG: hypothetical protein DRP78_04470 [Candidatus Omnitrophota bacterium]